MTLTRKEAASKALDVAYDAVCNADVANWRDLTEAWGKAAAEFAAACEEEGDCSERVGA